ncbi:hypothetical protein WJU23_10820 [Prosthecobacter sp. SYSU 5D2]|uniref:hypothetical protein n=1 Tax=Prosthecobacter sp. SYSU 5D2 TaxID=3134134 RepID=UPI0031FEA003
MLVYANEFYLQANPDHLKKVKEGIKYWLDGKIGPAFHRTKIIPFAENMIIRDPKTGINDISIIGTPDHALDYCLSINFRHNDSQVSGRAWFTRIGLERPSPDAPMRVTVLLETSEISPQVALNPVSPSKPGVVSEILNRCEVDPRTPGKEIKTLNPEFLAEFQSEIANVNRRYPILVVSPDDFSEKALVDTNDLRKRLVGLAQTYLIPDKRSAWRLRESVPAYHTAWDGSITVIGPMGEGRALGRVYKNDEIEAICHDTGFSFERYLFEEITHRSNLSMSRRHTGHDVVSRRLVAFKLAKLREEATTVESLNEIVKVYEEDRNKALQDVNELEFRLLATEEANEGLKQQIGDLDKKIRTLQFQLKQARESTDREEVLQETDLVPGSLAEMTSALQSHYGDQLEITGNAERTMKKSPYEDVGRAWSAFKVLATHFYGAFTQQLQMQDAIEELRLVPGEYAGNNSKVTAGRFDGYERIHNGKKYALNKHIALGNARDPRLCFRLYFEWEPDQKKIIILHAGEHLDTLSS